MWWLVKREVIAMSFDVQVPALLAGIIITRIISVVIWQYSD